MKTVKVKIQFTEQLLGTAPADPGIHETFVASKAPDAPSMEEELESLGDDGVQEIVEKSKRIFPRDDDGRRFLWDYQIKGFFKDACGMLRRASGTISSKLNSHKKIIDGLVFVYPRKIYLELPPNGEITEFQRPLRANTPKGEITALNHTESAPPGTVINFEIQYRKLIKGNDKNNPDLLKSCLLEWLDYGEERGLGQWRNSGVGRFKWTEIE